VDSLDSYDIQEFLKAFDQAVASMNDFDYLMIVHHFWHMGRTSEWIAKNITTLGMTQNQVEEKLKEIFAYVHKRLIKKFGEEAFMDYVNNWDIVLRFL